MRVNYKEGSKKLYFLIGTGIVFSTLIFVTYESSQALTIILCFVSVIAWLGVFFEVQAMKKKRIADLEMYAVNNNYNFSSKPKSAEITEFKNFKAMQKILIPNSFLNLLTPITTTSSREFNNLKIVTISSVVNTGQSSQTYYTQIFLFKLEKEIPIFFLNGGHNSFFGNLFSNKYIFKGIKELIAVNIKKYNFPKNKYKLYASDTKIIKDFFTERFVELLNIGLKKKKKRLHIESDGKNIIFYVKYKRHTTEGIDFYINLSKALIESLNNIKQSS
jgi:hypothetical protein